LLLEKTSQHAFQMPEYDFHESSRQCAFIAANRMV